MKMAFSTDLGCAPDNEIKRYFSKIEVIKNCFNYSNNDNPDFLNIHDCFEVIRGFNYVASHLKRLKIIKNF